MITIYKNERTRLKLDGNTILIELRGLSTDDKPTTVNGKKIDNGSSFIEIDTGKKYLFDAENQEWHLISG